MGRSRPRLLVTGVSGMLGANLALDLRESHAITGTCHDHLAAFPEVAVRRLDMASPNQVLACLREVSPDAVVHCAAATNVDVCQANPDWARRVNALGTRAVAQGCAEIGAHMTYLSTDAVFSGQRGGYGEKDATGPLNVYAASKLEGEVLAREYCRDLLVLRTNIYGLGPRPGHGLLGWILDRARTGRPLTGFTDVFFAPVAVNQLAEVIRAALERRLTGLYHVASRHALSKYAFARLALWTFGHDPAMVARGRLAEANLKAPRPLRADLDGTLLREVLPAIGDLGVKAGLGLVYALADAGRARDLLESATL